MTQPSPKRFQARGEAGFTLLEVVAAFAVLTLAISGLVFMGTLSTSSNTRSQNEAEAISLATYKLEQLKAMDFASTSLVSGTDTVQTIFSRSWTVSSAYTLASSQAKDLSVSVSWTGGGTVTLSTTVIEANRWMGGFAPVTVTSWSST